MVNYFNALKTEYIIISKRKTNTMHPDLLLNDTKLTEANNHKHLGLHVTISNNMYWSSHINGILAKAEKRLGQNIFYQEVTLLAIQKHDTSLTRLL